MIQDAIVLETLEPKHAPIWADLVRAMESQFRESFVRHGTSTEEVLADPHRYLQSRSRQSKIRGQGLPQASFLAISGGRAVGSIRLQLR